MEVFEVVTFKELMKRYLDGELILGGYMAVQDGVLVHVDFSKDSIKIDSPRTEIKLDTKFKVIKHIDKDTVLEQTVIVCEKEGKVETYNIKWVSINDILAVHSRTDEPVISISTLQGKELVKVWEDGEML